MRTEAVQDLDAAAPSGREVIAAARLFHRVLRTRLNQCFDEEFGLTYAQYEILQVLEDEPNLHASELGRRLCMTRQAANRLVERLRRLGLIDLAPRDGGLRVIWLTDLGLKRVATARKSVVCVERAVEKLPEETRIALAEALGAGKLALIPPTRPWWWE